MRALRDATLVKKGYKGFELVETTLSDLHEAISNSRDRDEIVKWLKRAIATKALRDSGQVAPAVKRTREKFEAICAILEALKL